jgi:polyhydroxyalkanoate synthesis regulator protein
LIVHDLDAANINQLKCNIASALGKSPIDTHLIVIPVKAIEAWLLADHDAVSKAMKLRQPLSRVPNPEAIARPKEHLGRLIYVQSEHTRRYINTLDNKK